MPHPEPGPELPVIPVYDVGPDFPLETLEIGTRRVHALLDEAAGRYPGAALRLADAISRRWLDRCQSPHLEEIDRISAHIGRPGAYYFNVSYEWGCSTSVGPGPDGRAARLMRVLDWPNHGLGRHLIAARIEGAAGHWISLAWPGYTGVLQAMAPGRFAAALNQAPMPQPVGFLPLDWAMNRVEVWKSPHLTPAHLLRRVFEQARDYGEAKRLLAETPIALPTIYSLSGTRPDESCIIERQPEEAYLIEGPASAANDWQHPGWNGLNRGEDSERRARIMAGQRRDLDPAFDWVVPPVRNTHTRLALQADAGAGRLLAQGYEVDGPATQVLNLQA